MENNGIIEIARISTFVTENRRDIVRRLMGCCESFKRISFYEAMKQFRYYETNGLVKSQDGYLVVYHDCN